MSKIIVYTTHCPRCKVLEKTLNSLNYEYVAVEDVEKILKMGITEVPYMEVDGELMNFKMAMLWLKEKLDGKH